MPRIASFAGVVLVSGFASVFVDPAYGQKALAATPSAVVSVSPVHFIICKVV